MKNMDPKNTAPMQWKRNQHKTAKEVIVKSHSSEQWGQKLGQKPANTEGKQSQQPMTTLEDKGRRTYRQHTPGCTERRGQEIVETMPLPTKLKAKWEVKLWEEEEDERTEETTGRADQIEENKRDVSLL